MCFVLSHRVSCVFSIAFGVFQMMREARRLRLQYFLFQTKNPCRIFPVSISPTHRNLPQFRFRLRQISAIQPRRIGKTTYGGTFISGKSRSHPFAKSSNKSLNIRVKLPERATCFCLFDRTFINSTRTLLQNVFAFSVSLIIGNCPSDCFKKLADQISGNIQTIDFWKRPRQCRNFQVVYAFPNLFSIANREENQPDKLNPFADLFARPRSKLFAR